MNRTLSEYEKQINAASLFLCQENVSLLSNRKKLFEFAKQKIDADGYNYKKKTSRSKVFGSVQKVTAGSEVRKVKIMKEIRQKKMDDLREDIESCKQTISLLGQQRSKFVAAEKFIQAADIVEQVKNQRKKSRELELELGKYEKAEARSTKYNKQKHKKLVSVKSQSQQKLKFTLPGAFSNTKSNTKINEDSQEVVPSCSFSANTVSPTEDNENSSSGSLNCSAPANTVHPTEDSLNSSSGSLNCSAPANIESSDVVEIKQDSLRGISNQSASKPDQSFC